MSAKNESHGSAANPSTDAPPNRVRDGSNPARHDSSEGNTNNPPNHGAPTYGVSRFLFEVDHRTLPEEGWIDELAERYQVWSNDTEQAELSGWFH